jgi:hypothetical protein
MQKLIEIYSRPRLAEKIQHMFISLDDLDYPFLLKVGTVRHSAASSTVLHVLSMRYCFPVHSHSKPQSCQGYTFTRKLLEEEELTDASIRRTSALVMEVAFSRSCANPKPVLEPSAEFFDGH